MDIRTQTAEYASLDLWVKRYLRDKGKRGRTEELVPELLGLLEPFITIAGQRRYPLAEWTALSVREIAAAIEMATDCRVENVLPLSVSRSCIADWRETNSLQSHLFAREQEMRSGNWAQEVAYLRDELSIRLFEALRRVISLTTGPALRPAMGTNRWNKGPKLTLTRSVEKVILLAVGFAKNGNREGLNLVAPLVRVLTRTLVLGEALGEPRSWLVITA